MERKLVHFSEEPSRTSRDSWDEEPDPFAAADTRWVVNPAAAALAAKRRAATPRPSNPKVRAPGSPAPGSPIQGSPAQRSSTPGTPNPVERSVTAPSPDNGQLHRLHAARGRTSNLSS